jgi:hypothetical protein
VEKFLKFWSLAGSADRNALVLGLAWLKRTLLEVDVA